MIDHLHIFFMATSFAFGSVVGSFLNVCVHRIPRDLSIVTPPSACPKCETRIAWYDNIPMLSWLALGAKCRHCKTPIHWRYPLVEAITGVLFLLVYWKHGFVPATPVYMLLAASLVLVTFVDLSDWIIPNEVTYPGIPLGIVWSIVVMFQGESTGGVIPHGVYDGVFDALLGVLLGGGSLYLMDKLSLVLLGKRGMGFGDVKLLAMLGAFFGWQSVILIIMMASIIGSIIGVSQILYLRAFPPAEKDEEESDEHEEKKSDHGYEDEEEVPTDGHYLPFGPFLAIAGLVIIFFGPEIFDFYYSNFVNITIQSTIPL
jgi:leader peptidase (prepilin peptidase)/N-methyltransferase